MTTISKAILADLISPAVPQLKKEIDELVYKLYGLIAEDSGRQGEKERANNPR